MFRRFSLISLTDRVGKRSVETSFSWPDMISLALALALALAIRIGVPSLTAAIAAADQILDSRELIRSFGRAKQLVTVWLY